MPAPHEPTERLRTEVQALASFGVPQDEIASYIDVSESTLRKHYRKELDLGATRANAAVGKFLFSLASGAAIQKGAKWSDCKVAAIFWAKTRMGFRETLDLSNADRSLSTGLVEYQEAVLAALAARHDAQEAGGDDQSEP